MILYSRKENPLKNVGEKWNFSMVKQKKKGKIKIEEEEEVGDEEEEEKKILLIIT